MATSLLNYANLEFVHFNKTLKFVFHSKSANNRVKIVFAFVFVIVFYILFICIHISSNYKKKYIFEINNQY
jgi:hypothetical protein